MAAISNLPSPLNNALIGGDITPLSLYNAEKHLWPGKISEAKVPCYIVPIKPRWARSLFEERISEGDIFGFDSRLLFSRRNVYYRAPRPRIPTEGRIIWYISKESNSGKYGQLRASSYVEAVAVSSAKALFRKYQSLGVYKWSDIFSLAKGDAQNQIMGFEFSDTELFDKPISFANIQEILIKAGRSSNQLVGPLEISHDIFMEIYAMMC